MEDNKLDQLPIVMDDVYAGVVKESELLEWETPEKSLSEAEFLNYKPAVLFSSHPYEALRIFHQNKMGLLPVVDSENKYVGAITAGSLLAFMAENGGFESAGGVIVLEILPHNYSLYQIARICENEDITIISSHMCTNPNGAMEVTIKTTQTSLDAVVSSLERHEYKVLEVYGDATSLEDMMDKYHLLMNYINM
jgi:CBS domain-containing protein